jgi:DNA-binding transcriptional LysR family regulator
LTKNAGCVKFFKKEGGIKMDLRQLRTFCLVGEKRSFSEASKSVYLTQPAVSFQIKSLEDYYDAKIVKHNRTKGLTLTRFGEVLYQSGREILRMEEKIKQTIDEMKGLVRGKLVIKTCFIPGEYILPPLLINSRKNILGFRVN